MQSTSTVSTLLTEKQVAQRLGLSTKTLQQWRWRGIGPRFRKLNYAVRYDPNDIELYIESAGRNSTSEGVKDYGD